MPGGNSVRRSLIGHDLFDDIPKPVPPPVLQPDPSKSLLKRALDSVKQRSNMASLQGGTTSEYDGGLSDLYQRFLEENANLPLPILTGNEVRVELSPFEGPLDASVGNSTNIHQHEFSLMEMRLDSSVGKSPNNHHPPQHLSTNLSIGKPTEGAIMKKMSRAAVCEEKFIQIYRSSDNGSKMFFPMEQPAPYPQIEYGEYAPRSVQLPPTMNGSYPHYYPLVNSKASLEAVNSQPITTVNESYAAPCPVVNEYAPRSTQLPPIMNGSYPHYYQLLNSKASLEAVNSQPTLTVNGSYAAPYPQIEYDEYAPRSVQLPPTMNGSYPHYYPLVNSKASLEAVNSQPTPTMNGSYAAPCPVVNEYAPRSTRLPPTMNGSYPHPSQYRAAMSILKSLDVCRSPVQLYKIDYGQQPAEVRGETEKDEANQIPLALEYPNLESKYTKSMRQEFRKMLEPLNKILDRIRMYQKDCDQLKFYMDQLKPGKMEFVNILSLHDGLLCKLNLLYYKKGGAFFNIVVPTTRVFEVLQDIHHTYHDYPVVKIQELIENLFDCPRLFPLEEIGSIVNQCKECNKVDGEESPETERGDMWNGEMPDENSSEQHEMDSFHPLPLEIDPMFKSWRKRQQDINHRFDDRDIKRHKYDQSCDTEKDGEPRTDTSTTSDIHSSKLVSIEKLFNESTLGVEKEGEQSKGRKIPTPRSCEPREFGTNELFLKGENKVGDDPMVKSVTKHQPESLKRKDKDRGRLEHQRPSSSCATRERNETRSDGKNKRKERSKSCHSENKTTIWSKPLEYYIADRHANSGVPHFSRTGKIFIRTNNDNMNGYDNNNKRVRQSTKYQRAGSAGPYSKFQNDFKLTESDEEKVGMNVFKKRIRHYGYHSSQQRYYNAGKYSEFGESFSYRHTPRTPKKFHLASGNEEMRCNDIGKKRVQPNFHGKNGPSTKNGEKCPEPTKCKKVKCLERKEIGKKGNAVSSKKANNLASKDGFKNHQKSDAVAMKGSVNGIKKPKLDSTKKPKPVDKEESKKIENGDEAAVGVKDCVVAKHAKPNNNVETHRSVQHQNSDVAVMEKWWLSFKETMNPMVPGVKKPVMIGLKKSVSNSIKEQNAMLKKDPVIRENGEDAAADVKHSVVSNHPKSNDKAEPNNEPTVQNRSTFDAARYAEQIRAAQMKIVSLRSLVAGLEVPSKESSDSSLKLLSGMLCRTVPALEGQHRQKNRIVVTPDCLKPIIEVFHTMSEPHADFQKILTHVNMCMSITLSASSTSHSLPVDCLESAISEVLSTCEKCCSGV